MSNLILAALAGASLLFCPALQAEPAPGTGSSTVAPADQAPVIRAVRGHLFSEGSGTLDLSTDIFTAGPFWNTRDSKTLLVLTVLDGPPVNGRTKGTVAVSARIGGRVVARGQFSLNSYYSKGRTLTLPLLVHATFCAPVEIEAMLVVPGAPTSKLKGTAEFKCGE